MPIPDPLERSTPEAQGVSSSALLAFVEDAEQRLDALHSFMLLRHGRVVAQAWWSPYGPEHPHMLFSLSKSFTSTAVGLAVDEGRLRVDDPVLRFFSEDAPAEPGEHLKAMRVRHLLSMSTGHAEDTMGPMSGAQDGNWARGFLAQPVVHAPGTHFLYNNGATYMLSAILQRLAGAPLLEYLERRLFGPLGIRGATWESCPRGVNFGGFGLSAKTEDIVRLGQLYLQKGEWQGRRLLSEAWVAQATSRQVANGSKPESDWEQGYGYQFWRCRHDAYRGDGAFGQFCIVMPDQDAVLAVTSGVRDMQAVLDLVWERVLPGFAPGPLPADPQAHAPLDRKLASLSLAPQAGAPVSPLAARVSGRRYVFPANDQHLEAIAFDFGRDTCRVTVWDQRGVHPGTVGCGAWLKGTTSFDRDQPHPVAASGAWIAEDTYAMKLCFYETPFCPAIRCRFTGDGLLYDREDNVSFGPTTRPQLAGRA